MKRAVLAVFRPKANDIAVYVEDRGEHQQVDLTITEARAIHGAIGLALRCADAAAAEDPQAAMPGAA